MVERMEEAKRWDPDKVFRFCPVCGADAFRPKDPKSFLHPAQLGGSNDLVCSSCGFTLFINASLAVSALITHPQTGDILMTLRNRDPHKGTYSLPGGFVAPGERAEEALVREILEETGLRVTRATAEPRTYPSTYRYRGITYSTTEIAYRCTCEPAEGAFDADPAEAELRWVSEAELAQIPIGLESIQNIISDVIQGLISLR